MTGHARYSPTHAGQFLVVKTLLDVFAWPRANLVLAQHRHPDWLDQDVVDIANTSLQDLTISTAFSGIDCPGISLNMLVEELHHVFPALPHVRNLCAIEAHAECIRELMLMPHGPAHVFGNILDFCTDALRARLDVETRYDYDEMRALILQPGQVLLKAACRSCACVGKACRCAFACARLHIAGTPCTDFSSLGAMLAKNGPTISFFLVWTQMRYELMEELILLENVPNFPLELLRQLFSFAYDIHSIVLCATQFGKSMRRRRRYTLLVRRAVVELTRPLSATVELFGRERAPSHTWHDFLCANTGELCSELRWAYSREDTAPMPPLDGLTEFPRELWENALIPGERARLETFLTEFGGARLLCSIATDPDYTAMASGLEVMQCIIKHCHILWTEVFGRWLTARETALAMGIP